MTTEHKGIEVYKSIAAVTGALAQEGISKDRKNQQQGFAYRGIDDVYAALSPLLAANHLCILPRMVKLDAAERTSAKGGVLFYTAVTGEFDIVSAIDGSRHTVISYGEAFDSGDKSIGKAMSYAYKAMAFMTFAIPTEGDNDPDAKTHEIEPRTRYQTAKTAAQGQKSGVPVSEAQKALLNELGAIYTGNEEEMGRALREYSTFMAKDPKNPEGDKIERYLKLVDLENGSDNDKFQKWVSGALDRLKKDIAKR